MRHRAIRCLSAVAVLLVGLGAARAAPIKAAPIPADVARQVPPGYVVLGSGAASFGGHAFAIVALGRRGEDQQRRPIQSAAARPLLLFERRPDGSFRPAGRNDHVVMRADEGGQCDPFLDGGGVIAAKGPRFTVQNGVACGQHWTNYVTFRFDGSKGRYVFDNERSESWSMNASQDPNAQAMVQDGPTRVQRGPANPVPFARWRPSR